MGHNKGRDNARKRAKRRKKHERLASAKQPSRDATARQAKAGKITRCYRSYYAAAESNQLVAIRGRDEYQRKTRRVPPARISLAPEEVADQR